MKSTRVEVTNQDVNAVAADLLVFLAVENEEGKPVSDKKILRMLQPQIESGDFSGKLDQIVCLYPASSKGKSNYAAPRLLVLGLGKHEENTADMLRESFRHAGGILAGQCQKLKISRLALVLSGIKGIHPSEMAECLIEGMLLGDYRFDKYKKPEENTYCGIDEIKIIGKTDLAKIEQAMQSAQRSAQAACVARDMANEPGNGWTAEHFAQYARQISEKYSLNCTVLGKDALKTLKMGGLLAVNQGSASEPYLVAVSYIPQNKKGSVLLVGKGLTFDSGGICLKPAENMQDMKYDMCGGAAVLSAMQAIAEDRPDVEVTAIVPATDNMSGSRALKPGDIITHYSGLTSEIINTDAEGRLILADALAYGIETYKPDCVLDLATLTGAVIIALGHHHSGILGTDEKLIHCVQKAGLRAGEPFWQLPLGKDYSKQIESKVADIKNTGGRPAGTITAAAYLQKFVGDIPWAHLDIAGTAWDFTEKSYIPKGPSGFGVRTLIEFIRSYTAK